MPVEYQRNKAVLTGVCTVEEAENLLVWIKKHPKSPVHLTEIQHIHTALLQVLLASKPKVRIKIADNDFSTWIVPQLRMGIQSK